MESSLDQVKKLLQDSKTFVAMFPDGTIYTSEKKGIAPVIEKMHSDYNFFKGALVADRVIGKATAMLLISSGAAAIYGELFSQHAFAVFEEHKKTSPDFYFETGEVVPYIINRQKTDMCPMEKTVLNLPASDSDKAYAMLKKALEDMR